MASPQIKSLSIKHEEILKFLVCNPHLRLRDVAAHFNVSQSWLSIIIHSDAFQEKLAELQEKDYIMSIQPLREKMRGIASMALDKVAEELDNPNVTLTAAVEIGSTFLDRLGYGPKATTPPGPAGQVIQQNNFYVQREVLVEARRNFGKVIEHQDNEVADDENTLTLEAQTGGDSGMGEGTAGSAQLCIESREESEGGEG